MSEPTPQSQDVSPMVVDIWGQARAWGTLSVSLKRRMELSNLAAVVLGVVGAVLGTAAGAANPPSSGADPVFLGIPADNLALLSAVAIGVAAYVGRQLLTPGREAEWLKIRMLAEALTRATWKRVMEVPPYDGDEPDRMLLDTANQLENAAAPGLMRPNASGGRPPPTTRSIQLYIRKRVEDQIAYYTTKSTEAAQVVGRVGRWTFILGLAAVLFGLFGVRYPALPIWVATITTLSAAVVALFRADRLTSVAPLYQATARHLSRLRSLWMVTEKKRSGRTDEEVRALETEFVMACEQAMAQENESWRAELEQLAGSTLTLLSKLQDSVPEPASPPEADEDVG